MKRILFPMFFIVALTSCVTAPSDRKQTIVTNEVNGVEVVIAEQINEQNLLNTQFLGLSVIITNKTDNPITINWDKSSIAINKQTDNIFISGQKFIDSGTSLPPITIAKGNKKVVAIFPASSIVLNGSNWQILSTSCEIGDLIDLTLDIESGTDNFFTTTTWKRE